MIRYDRKGRPGRLHFALTRPLVSTKIRADGSVTPGDSVGRVEDPVAACCHFQDGASSRDVRGSRNRCHPVARTREDASHGWSWPGRGTPTPHRSWGVVEKLAP